MSRYLLGDMKFLEKLMDYDIQSVPEAKFHRLRTYYFEIPNFQSENILKQSTAASQIF